MKKEKNINYYRSLLHKDSITLLVIAIIFVIANFIFIDGGTEEAVPIFLKSIMFAIFSIIVICNRKETKKFIGVLTIITSCLMILTSIGDWSLFGVVYFLLGIFLITHSILYLRKLKESNYFETSIVDNVKRKTKLKYLTLIPNIISCLFIFGFIVEQLSIKILIYSIIIIFNIINIIFGISINRKYNKSVLVYITMIISILAVLINGIFLIDDVGSVIHKKIKYNSESYFVELCKNADNSINDKIALLEILTSLNINIGENTVIQLDDYLASDSIN